MAAQAEELLGARLMGADGKVVGTVEQVFRDDTDGTPAWARVRSGKTGRFVPLANCQLTSDGLNVPFDSQKIMGGPNVDAGQHMSAAQAERLSRYYGTTVPAQSQPLRITDNRIGDNRITDNRVTDSRVTDHRISGNRVSGSRISDNGIRSINDNRIIDNRITDNRMVDEVSLIRLEERLQVGTETVETARVRLHKYVDVEAVEEPVHVFHEEYDVERIPVNPDERIRADMEEGEQEIILHESRAVIHKEVVPVERVRLVARRVEEDKTITSEVRRERIEIEPDESPAGNGRPDLGISR